MTVWATVFSSAAPKMLFGLRLWAAVCLALYVAYTLELDNAYWAGTSAAAVSLPSLGASLRKGASRMLGTVIGGVAIVILAACFPQSRAGFLTGLALWGAACGFAARIFGNSSSYGAALAGFTGLIIGGNALGAFGGAAGDVFMLAFTRTSEICIGIVCSAVVLAGTDLGGARKRLTMQIAALCADITGRFVDALLHTESIGEETRAGRWELARRTVALGAAIDEVIGEDSDLRHHVPGLQAAAEGLLAALSGWRVVANHLELLPQERRQQEAEAILQDLPPELRALPASGEATRWISDLDGLRFACIAAVRALARSPVESPSLRTIVDATAEALIGLSKALDALALLTDRRRNTWPVRSRIGGVPDYLPPVIDALRIFLTIVAGELFWIATAWPNGATALTWAGIFVIIAAPRPDRAHAHAKSLLFGVCLATVLAGVVKFAVLPGEETFVSLAVSIGLVLVPTSILSTLGWQAPTFVAATSWFTALTGVENQITYDTQQFYNSSLAIVSGAAAATLAFSLLPPLSPAVRARRLLALTLRALRRLATARGWPDERAWRSRVYRCLASLPESTDALQRARLLAALSMGADVLRLKNIALRFRLDRDLDKALSSLARGDSEGTIAGLAAVDRGLAAFPAGGPGRRVRLRARGSILAMSEALARHRTYFDWWEAA